MDVSRMQFRLRTLLIVVMVACVVCARIAYLRQKAETHRQAAAQFMTRIEQYSEADAWAFRRLIADGLLTQTIDLETTVAALQDRSGTGRIVQADRAAAWQGALHHSALATQYEKAVYQPWLLVNEEER